MKKLILLFLTLLFVFSNVISVSASESEAETEQPSYPCYCSECIRTFQEKYNQSEASSIYPLKLTGSAEQYNGYYLFIGESFGTYHLIFAKRYSYVDSYFYFLEYDSAVISSSLTIDLSKLSFNSLSDYRASTSFWKFFYAPVEFNDPDYIITGITWPTNPYVKYDIGRASGTAPSDAYNSTVIIPSSAGLNYPGYLFRGWTDGTNTYLPGQVIYPENHIILTAIWERNKTTVEHITEGIETMAEPVNKKVVASTVGYILGAACIVFIALWAVKKLIKHIVKSLKGRW